MSETTEQIEPVEPADAPAAAPTTTATVPVTPLARRTVTLRVLPLAIVAAVIVALLFFGGGIALALAIGSHDDRGPRFEPGTNQNDGAGPQNGTGGPGQRATTGPVAPRN